MPRETGPPRCHLCCRFISYKDLETAVCWTPYGDASMTEPPLEEYAHHPCWQGAGDDRRKMIEAIAWAKPYARSGEVAVTAFHDGGSS